MGFWDDIEPWFVPKKPNYGHNTSSNKSPPPDGGRLNEAGVPPEWTWLYDTENWSDFDWTWFKMLYNTTYGKKWADYVYAARRDREYMERHGIDRSDIHDPTRLYSIRALGGLNWNPLPTSLERLYR